MRVNHDDQRRQLWDCNRASGWDTRAALLHKHLECARCGKQPYRVGISADRLRAQSVQGPLTLAGMREQRVHHVDVDCSCPGAQLVNVDHLPGWLPVPDVRFRVDCPGCGTKATRVRPKRVERTAKRPGLR